MTPPATGIETPPEADRTVIAPYHRLHLALVIGTLVLALLLGTGLRIDSMRHKHGFHVDEWWSYETASGHLLDFSTQHGVSLYGRWVPAREWKQQWKPASAVDFAQIAHDLGAHDVHPPLYFWALHVWMLLFGVRFWTGPLLNLLIDILTGAALFGLARRLLHDPLAAALVVLIWAVSPAVRVTSSMARMYPLLALFAVLFVWMLVRAVDDHEHVGLRASLPALALLTAATFGGMFSQYQFVLIVAGGALYAAVRLARADWRRCLGVLASLGVGLALVAIAQPSIVAQFRLEAHKAREPFTNAALAAKVNGTTDTVFGFFGFNKTWLTRAIDGPVRLGGILPSHRVSPFVFLVGWATVALLVAFIVPRSRAWLLRRDRRGLLALVFLAWIAGTIIAQNLLFLAQPAVLSARYLAAAWPFFAFVPVLLGRALVPRAPNALPAAFCLAFMVPATFAPVNVASTLGPLRAVKDARRAVVETTMPSTLPIALWCMPDNTMVYVDLAARLLTQPSRWLDPLSTGDYFVLRLKGGQGGLRELRAHRLLTPIPGVSNGLVVYRIGPPR